MAMKFLVALCALGALICAVIASLMGRKAAAVQPVPLHERLGTIEPFDSGQKAIDYALGNTQAINAAAPMNRAAAAWSIAAAAFSFVAGLLALVG
ncbi:MAG: hypothetical protein EPN40_10415 [Rhodanobacteraceae bacterium]|nr:MAG: hypothetical protein EPN40_10415 [Rhodanobacteraceae bacterium]